MMNMRTGQWSGTVLDALDLPKHILPPVIQPGQIIGAGMIDLDSL